MATFAGVMNWLVPTLVLFVFGYILIKPISEPFIRLYTWLRDIFRRGKEGDTIEGPQTVTYE